MGITDPVEELSAELHAIYQQEARRQAGIGDDEVRHPDDYDALPEHTKEYDRVLARFILAREERAMRVIQASRALLEKVHECAMGTVTSDVVSDSINTFIEALRAWDGNNG